MKVLRIVLWVILIFVFIRGLVSIVRPDSYHVAIDTIKEFRDDFSKIKNSEEELFAFSQNFIYEYTTYEIRKEIDYINRIKNYANIAFTKELRFTGKAECLYARAYRLEKYAENRYNVYVLAKVQYTKKKMDEKNTTFIDDVIVQERVFKVPIYQEKGKYIVDDFPAYVEDSQKIENFRPISYNGKELTIDESVKIRESLNNFFHSYYEDEQSIIDYYLSSNADKTKFKGLNKQVLYKELQSLKVYKQNQDTYLALVGLIVSDQDTEIQQNFNVLVVVKDSRYYIEDFDTRVTNLKYQNNKE